MLDALTRQSEVLLVVRGSLLVRLDLLLEVVDPLLKLSLLAVDIVLQGHVEVLHGLEGESFTLLAEDQLLVLELGTAGTVQELLLELVDVVQDLLRPFVSIQPDLRLNLVHEWLHHLL